jgi:hypothetical protein
VPAFGALAYRAADCFPGRLCLFGSSLHFHSIPQ